MTDLWVRIFFLFTNRSVRGKNWPSFYLSSSSWKKLAWNSLQQNVCYFISLYVTWDIVVSSKGVETDREKVSALHTWPTPQNLSKAWQDTIAREQRTIPGLSNPWTIVLEAWINSSKICTLVGITKVVRSLTIQAEIRVRFFGSLLGMLGNLKAKGEKSLVWLNNTTKPLCGCSEEKFFRRRNPEHKQPHGGEVERSLGDKKLKE